MKGTASSITADIVAQDREARPILVVEAKSAMGGLDRGKAQLSSSLSALQASIPFAMFVDLENIYLFRWDGAHLSGPICTLKSSEILGRYDAEFDNKRIFEPYLTTLVEAWLRDLAYHWKSDQPPAAEQLAAVGLLPLLEGGDTYSEVDLGRLSLR
jgi:hypothetical protein